ncbi:serine O-acetyltransferase [Cyclobacterium sp. SYSU L10401]|uniref:serine O-acetyltransferase n=1 Tax=Cyclobacterium sp. SYSU L10401 TaxID=2678657 RepID=UPI0013D6B0E8|nr:hypothetical protein [Cyclobacterium sp. SYSU L10401]
MYDFRMSRSELLELIRSDAGAEKGKFFLKVAKKLLISNSFKLILNYRLGYFFQTRGNAWLCKLLKHRQIKRHSCQISYKAKIGKKISFPHPIAIVIGDGVQIADRVKIWQQVTIGSHGKAGTDLQYPKIGSGVRIFTGAVVIGDVQLGENSTVGALSLVTRDVAPNSTVAGAPAKPIR